MYVATDSAVLDNKGLGFFSLYCCILWILSCSMFSLKLNLANFVFKIFAKMTFQREQILILCILLAVRYIEKLKLTPKILFMQVAYILKHGWGIFFFHGLKSQVI